MCSNILGQTTMIIVVAVCCDFFDKSYCVVSSMKYDSQTTDPNNEYPESTFSHSEKEESNYLNFTVSDNIIHKSVDVTRRRFLEILDTTLLPSSVATATTRRPLSNIRTTTYVPFESTTIADANNAKTYGISNTKNGSGVEEIYYSTTPRDGEPAMTPAGTTLLNTENNFEEKAATTKPTTNLWSTTEVHHKDGSVLTTAAFKIPVINVHSKTTEVQTDTTNLVNTITTVGSEITRDTSDSSTKTITHEIPNTTTFTTIEVPESTLTTGQNSDITTVTSTSTSNWNTTTPESTTQSTATTPNVICTVPTAPICNVTSISQTDVNITCDIAQNGTQVCTPENLAINCEALEDDNQSFDWIVRTTNSTTQISNSSNSSILVTLEELSEYTNYTCNATLNDGSSDRFSFIFTTLEGVPSAPENLSTTNISATSFTLTWNKPAKIPGTLLHYNLQIITASANHQILENCSGSDYVVNASFTTEKEIFTFENALPDINYNVSVFGVTSAGDGEMAILHVTTNSTASQAPTNVQCTSEERYDGNYTMYFYTETSWKTPCNTNGPEKYFLLLLSGVYTLNSTVTDNKNATEDFDPNFTNHSIYFSIMPSMQYEYSVSLIGEDGSQGEKAYCNFSTKDDYPGAPVLYNVTEISSTSFHISWEKPEKIAGKLLNYSVTVESNGPKYPVTTQKCEDDVDRSTYNFFMDADTTFFNFTDGKPYYSYTVYVTANTSRGEGPVSQISVLTEASAPGKASNLTVNYMDRSDNVTLNCDLILTATWELPCDINGIFESYYVTLNGTYTEDPYMRDIRNEAVTGTLYERALNPSTNYSLTVEVRLRDGLVGEAVSYEFTTPSCYPGAPILNTPIDAMAKYFDISWLPPIENNGKITSYYLNVTELGPVMSYGGDECKYEEGYKVFNLSGSEESFSYQDALPYYKYSIYIFAETEKGNGSAKMTELKTSDSVPDNVVDITYSITPSSTVIYDSTAYIYFNPPCYTNGALQYYNVKYSGVRTNFPEHTNSTIVYEGSYHFALRPDYEYSVYISIHTTNYSNTAYPIKFVSQSGVPQFSTNSTLPTPEIKGESQATIHLRRKDFDETNGEIKYIALIISDRNVSGGEYNEWVNTSVWPVPTSSVASVYYQTNEKYWMPFSDSVSEVDFVIGERTNCTETHFCNRVLNESTEYFLIVRVFTKDFYKNSSPIGFITASATNLALILGLIFGLAAIAAILWILFVLWYKKKLHFRFAEKLYSRASSAKPPTEPTTEVPVSKFVNYCKHLENNPEKLRAQYELLGDKSKEVTAEQTNVYALLPENRRKNRYTNILPYDDTRVKLFMDEDDEIASDYINGSYIRGFTGAIQYIATQGPLPDTCRDFWKMVLQENVTVIIMVSHFIENNKVKCHKYFPNNHENMLIGDDIEVRCSTELHFGTYCVRTLQVQRELKQVLVTHLQFLDWPDFGVPQGTENMLQFCYQFQERHKLEGGCVVVHCSAGVGRTGTMIATDILLRHIKAGKKTVDVFKTVLDLRVQRINMVQTERQYMYIHSLIKDSLLDEQQTAERELQGGHELLYENVTAMSQDKKGNVHMESKF